LDQKFFEILTSARFGEDLDFVCEALKTRIVPQAEKSPIMLVSHRQQADKINLDRLNLLPFEQKTFFASHEGKPDFVQSFLAHFADRMQLNLKKGPE
jgi:hypothetical protein